MKRIIIRLIMLSLFLGAIATGISWHVRRNTGVRLLMRSRVAMEANNFSKAAEMARLYVNDTPENWKGHDLLGRALLRLGRYDEAREAFAEASRLAPTGEAGPILGLIKAYSYPSRELTDNPEAGSQIGELTRTIERFNEANRIALQAKTPDGKSTVDLDLKERMGHDYRLISSAWRALGNRYAEEAQRAEKVRFSFLAKARGDAAKTAAAEADRSVKMAIKALKEVVTEDASRPTAALELVEMCIQEADKETLAVARTAITALDAPPALAAMTLALHDLQSHKASTETERDEKVRDLCHRLDALLAENPDELRIKLARAEAAFMLSDLETAGRISKAVLDENPRQGRARLIEGGILMKKRDFAAAERVLFSLKSEYNRWPDAQHAYGLALAARGKHDGAMRAMRAAVDLDPTHAGALRFLAEGLARGGHFDRAMDDAKAYYQAYPHSPAAVRLLVLCAVGLERPRLALARRVLERAETDHGDSADMLFVVGEAYGHLGDRTKARQAFDKSIRCEAMFFSSRLAVARSLRRLGRTSEAEAILIAELSQTPDAMAVRYELATLCLATGRRFQAAEHLATALRSQPTNTDYRLALARLWFGAGDIDQCIEHLDQMPADHAEAELLRLRTMLVRNEIVKPERMLKQIARSPHAALALAGTYLNTGRPEWCVTVCEDALNSSPNHPGLRALLGRTYLAMGKEDQCVRQWAAVLRAAPREIQAYVNIASLLSRKDPPLKVAQALGKFHGADDDLIALTIAWLYSRQGDHTSAIRVYTQLADTPRAPETSRNRARVLLAGVLARTGKVDEALAELKKMPDDANWRHAVLKTRADILASAGRLDDAVVTLKELGAEAEAQRDPPTLREVTAQLVRLERFDDAVALADRVVAALPNDARSHLLQSTVLMAAGKSAEALPPLDKAIELQPTNLDLHVARANALDSLQRPAEALEALKSMDSLGGVGKARALFERGRLVSRWGLASQAVKAFEAMDAAGYGQSPAVRLAMGTALVRLGALDRARKILAEIGPHSPQYSQAQIILADVASGPDEKVAILADLRRTKPNSTTALAGQMAVLLDADKPRGASKAFQDFADRTDVMLPASAPANGLALEALLQADDITGASRFARSLARRSVADRWRHMAILLSVDSAPQAAAAMLADVDRAGLSDALLGIIVSSQVDDAEARDRWTRRVAYLSSEAAGRNWPMSVAPRYRLLAALAAETTDQDLASLARSADVGPTVAAELVTHRASGAAAAREAAALLKATLAIEWRVGELGMTWAADVLTKRPQCQWAAALVMQSEPDAEALAKVAALLKPTDCALALRIRGAIAGDAGKFAEAVTLYARAARAADNDPLLLLAQAVATERAGDLAGALALYRKVWQDAKDPQAANNAAYIVSQLHPDDPARLDEALTWARAAVEADPDNATYLDTRGWLALLRGQTDQARTDTLKAVSIRPRSVEIHYHAGAVLARTGQEEMARWHFQATVAAAQAIESRDETLTASAAGAVRLAREALDRAPS